MTEHQRKRRLKYFAKLASKQDKDVLFSIDPHHKERQAIKATDSFDGDVIAMHGLNGRFYRTWAYSNTFWLADLLADLLPRTLSKLHSSRFPILRKYSRDTKVR